VSSVIEKGNMPHKDRLTALCIICLYIT